MNFHHVGYRQIAMPKYKTKTYFDKLKKDLNIQIHKQICFIEGPVMKSCYKCAMRDEEYFITLNLLR